MLYQRLRHWRNLKSLCAVALWFILSGITSSQPLAARADDFDSSRCKAAFAAGDYASAAKDCHAEAEATLNAVKKSHLTGDSRADALGIAAIQMELASAAESRDGIPSDAARAPDSLNEAKLLIHQALKSCTTVKCRDRTQHAADRIDSTQDFSS
jgi:hypothetical protein